MIFSVGLMQWLLMFAPGNICPSCPIDFACYIIWQDDTVCLGYKCIFYTKIHLSIKWNIANNLELYFSLENIDKIIVNYMVKLHVYGNVEHRNWGKFWFLVKVFHHRYHIISMYQNEVLSAYLPFILSTFLSVLICLLHNRHLTIHMIMLCFFNYSQRKKMGVHNFWYPEMMLVKT